MADAPVKSFSSTAHLPDSVERGQVTPGKRDEQAAARLASGQSQEEVTLVVSPTSAANRSAHHQAISNPAAVGGTNARPGRQVARAAPATHVPSLESVDIVASIPKRTGIAVKDEPSVVVPIEMPGDDLTHGDVSLTQVLGPRRSVPWRKPAKPWLPVAVGISVAIVALVGFTLVFQSSKHRAVGSSAPVGTDKTTSVESLPTVTEHVVVPTPGHANTDQASAPGDIVDPSALAVAPSKAKNPALAKQRQAQGKTDNADGVANSAANKPGDGQTAPSANQDNSTNVGTTGARTDSTVATTTPGQSRPSSGTPASHKPPTRSTVPAGKKRSSKRGVIVRDNPF